jgi:hypothetical protein
MRDAIESLLAKIRFDFFASRLGGAAMGSLM